MEMITELKSKRAKKRMSEYAEVTENDKIECLNAKICIPFKLTKEIDLPEYKEMIMFLRKLKDIDLILSGPDSKKQKIDSDFVNLELQESLKSYFSRDDFLLEKALNNPVKLHHPNRKVHLRKLLDVFLSTNHDDRKISHLKDQYNNNSFQNTVSNSTIYYNLTKHLHIKYKTADSKPKNYFNERTFFEQIIFVNRVIKDHMECKEFMYFDEAGFLEETW